MSGVEMGEIVNAMKSGVAIKSSGLALFDARLTTSYLTLTKLYHELLRTRSEVG